MKTPVLVLAILSIGCSGDVSTLSADGPTSRTTSGVQAAQVAGEKVAVIAKLVRENSGEGRPC
jgi:hypothetical protein